MGSWVIPPFVKGVPVRAGVFIYELAKGFFAFRANVARKIVTAYGNRFFLKVRCIMAWGFSVRVTDRIPAHFALSAKFTYS